MKRVLPVLGWIIGVVLMVSGGAVAGSVGPDDLLELPAKPLPAGTRVMVTEPGLLAYRATTVQVRVTAEQGEAFVGAAHPVDVTSYLGTAHALRVQRIEPTGEVAGRLVGEPAAELPESPEALDIWSERAVGAGEQVVSVTLDGSPVQVLAQAGPEAALTVGFGARLPGIFVLALTLALVGLGVILLLVALRLRRRGRTDPTAVGVAGEAKEQAPAADQPAGVAHRSRLLAGALTITASLALSGCVSVPEPAVLPSELRKVAVPADGAKALLDDYDQRNNALIAAQVKKPDAKAWAAVDSGPVLVADRFDTAWHIASREKRSVVSFSHDGAVVHAPSFGAYPMWVITSSEEAVRPADPKRRAWTEFSVFHRESARQPWTNHMTASAEGVVAGPAPAVDATATSEQVTAAGELLKTAGRYLESGQKPTLAVGELAKLRKGWTEKSAIAARTMIACQPYRLSEKAAKSVFVVRTEAGSLMLGTLRCTVTVVPPKGHVLTWKPEMAEALGVAAVQTDGLVEHRYVTVAVESTSSAPQVLAVDVRTVRPHDTR